MSAILIIDDDPIVRELLSTVLTAEGHRASVASDGPDGIRMAQEERPDLIILDVGLPNMGGVQCLRCLRRNHDTQQTPVIMLSGEFHREDIVEAGRQHVVGFLSKSDFTLCRLVTTIRNALCFSAGESNSPVTTAIAPAVSSARGDETCEDAGALDATPRADDDDARPRDEVADDGAVPTMREPRRIRARRRRIDGGDAPPMSRHERREVWEKLRHDIELRSVPVVLSYALKLVNSSESTLDEIAGAVRQDAPLALNVLRVANSPLFARGRPIQSLTEATKRLGVSGIRNVLMTVQTTEQFPVARVGGTSAYHFWAHCLGAAVLTQSIAERVDARLKDDVFLAAILHDIGRMVLATSYPDDYDQLVARARREDRPLDVIESEHFGVAQTEVGKEILSQWRVPAPIIEAVTSHRLAVERAKRGGPGWQAAMILALADRVSHALLLGDSGDHTLLTISAHAAALGVPVKELAAFADQARNETEDLLTWYRTQMQSPDSSNLRNNLVQAPDPPRVAVVDSDDAGAHVRLFLAQFGWLVEDSADVTVHVQGAPSRTSASSASDARHDGQTGGLVVRTGDPGDHLASANIERRLAMSPQYDTLIDAILSAAGAEDIGPASGDASSLDTARETCAVGA